MNRLKKCNFFSLSLEEKLSIKKNGRPTPSLCIERKTQNKGKEITRTFKMAIYDKNEWICGCEVTNRLFCFPCLLFSVGDTETAWTRTGGVD